MEGEKGLFCFRVGKRNVETDGFVERIGGLLLNPYFYSISHLRRYIRGGINQRSNPIIRRGIP